MRASFTFSHLHAPLLAKKCTHDVDFNDDGGGGGGGGAGDGDDDCLMTSLVVSVRSVSPWQQGNDVVQVLSPHF